MNVYDLAEIRLAVSTVIDDGHPSDPRTRIWHFYDTDDPKQIDERTKFVDAVIALLVRRAKAAKEKRRLEG